MKKSILVVLTAILAWGFAVCAEDDDAALAKRCETTVTRFLLTFAGLQRHGGWAKIYHYPSFRRYGSGERHTLLAENDLDFGKGWGSAQKEMVLYLPAYEALGDQRWLDVARKTGDLLLKAETPLGVWSSNYLVLEGERPIAYGRPDVMGLEDSIQTHPTMFLTWLYRLTKDERYKAAAIKGAELLVRAQNPNGSWPQYWSLADGKPRGLGYAVLNDGATTEPMVVLLMMYHMTKDERWLAPIARAEDWLISAQNRQGGIPGWAEQYDADNRPCWARNFEPPAICPTPTSMAISALGLAYRLTGDKKYLEPMRILARWLREHSREEWGFYTAPKTADPVYGMGGKLYKGAQSPEVRISEWVRPGKHYNGAKLEAQIAELEQSGLKPMTSDGKAIRANELSKFSSRRETIEQLLAAQKPDGMWVGTSTRTRSEQAVRFLDTSPCIMLINDLYVRAIGEGRIPAVAAGSSEFWFRAWPVADPFDTPLRRGPVKAFNLPPLHRPVVTTSVVNKATEVATTASPPVPPPPAALHIEAESAALKPPFQIVDAEGASGGKAIWGPAGLVGLNKVYSPAAGLATLSFRIEKPGPHAIWLRVYWHTGMEDSFWLRLDDGQWQTLEGGVRGEWQWLRLGTAQTLAAGTHTLDFGIREDGSVLDAIEISADPKYVPKEQVTNEERPAEFQEAVPSAPTEAGGNMTLMSTFDGNSGDADFAKGDRRPGGVQFKLGQAGRFGSAVAFTTKEAYLLYMGGPNIPAERGRLSAWFRAASGANPFADGTDHYIGVVKYAPQVFRHVAEDRYQIFENTVALLFDGKSKSLVVRLNDGRRGVTTDLCAIPAEKLSPDQWHCLSLAWDYPARRVHLAVDGHGLAQTIPHPFDAREVLGLFLGNGMYYSVLNPLGGWLDQLEIASQPD